MKKTTITFLVACLIMVTSVKAQSLEDGIKHYNSGRIYSAINAFEKLLQTSPNNVEATYWLGQSYLENEEISSARIKNTKELYQKGLQNDPKAALLIIGAGQIDLLENRPAEAKQKFETALEMTKSRKGNDPEMLTAVGRAIVETKTGDFKYAIDRLEEAIERTKNPDTYTLLGTAYRKYGKGDGGGDAYKNYSKALDKFNGYAPANLKMAKIFESQKNWSLVLKYLLDAVAIDPGFSIGYYELFYYYFYRQDYAEAEKQLKKYIDSKKPDSDIQDEYLYAQLCWAKKDFNCAIMKGESVIAELGDKTKPKVYRLLADAALQNNDLNKAKKYSDLFFQKKNPDDVILPDFETKVSILAKANANVDEIYTTYIDGTTVDTTLDAKVDFLKKGVAYFKELKDRENEAKMLEKILSIKKEPIINDYFNIALAYYFNGSHTKSRNVSLTMISKFPDQVYGYDMALNNSRILDSVKKDSIALQDALNLYEFSKKDIEKYKTTYLSAVKFLAPYYINDAKDKENSLIYFRAWKQVDIPNAEAIQGYIDQIEKMPDVKPPSQKAESKAS